VSAASLRLIGVERIDTDWINKTAQLLVSNFGPLPWPMPSELGGTNRHMAIILCELFESAREVSCRSDNSEIQTVGAANVSI
jgi:hypothetical protein